MRYDHEHKQRTHQKLIEEASIAIREHGPDNISVAALMAKVGLTHGGFYAHFKSKDALVAETITYMLEELVKSFEHSLDGADLNEVLAHYIDAYLSVSHRDGRDTGCPIAALNGDVARMSEDTKVRFELGIDSSINGLSHILFKLNKKNPKELAGSMLTEMIGALAVSRTMSNSELSAWVLNNSRDSVKKRIGLAELEQSEDLS